MLYYYKEGVWGRTVAVFTVLFVLISVMLLIAGLIPDAENYDKASEIAFKYIVSSIRGQLTDTEYWYMYAFLYHVIFVILFYFSITIVNRILDESIIYTDIFSYIPPLWVWFGVIGWMVQTLEHHGNGNFIFDGIFFGIVYAVAVSITYFLLLILVKIIFRYSFCPYCFSKLEFFKTSFVYSCKSCQYVHRDGSVLDEDRM